MWSFAPPRGVADARETMPEVGSFTAALHLRTLDVAATAAALSELLGVDPPGADGVDAWVQAQGRGCPGSRGW